MSYCLRSLIALNSSSISCIFSSFGSFVVSDSLFDLLADVSHLGLVFSVHIFRLSMRAKSSWSLLSIVSSLRAAVTAVGCSSISVSSFVIAAVVAACFCSSISATSFAAAVALVASLLLKFLRFIVCRCRRRHRVLPLKYF